MAYPYHRLQPYNGVMHPAYLRMTGKPESIILVHGDRTRVVTKPQSFDKLTEVAREIFAVGNAEFLMSFWCYSSSRFIEVELDSSAYHLVTDKSRIRCVWKPNPNGNIDITDAFIARSLRGVGMPASNHLDAVEAKEHAGGMTSCSSSPYTEELTEIRDALHTACQTLRPLQTLAKAAQCNCSSLGTGTRQLCTYCVPLHPTVTYNRRSKKAACIRKIQQIVTEMTRDLVELQYIAAWEIPLLEMVDSDSDASSSGSNDWKLRLSKAKNGKAAVRKSKKISCKWKADNDSVTSSSSGPDSDQTDSISSGTGCDQTNSSFSTTRPRHCYCNKDSLWACIVCESDSSSQSDSDSSGDESPVACQTKMRTKGKTTRSFKTKDGHLTKTEAEAVSKTKTHHSTKAKVEFASKSEAVSDRNTERACDKKAEAVGQNNFPVSYGYQLSYYPYQLNGYSYYPYHPNSYWGGHSDGYTSYPPFPDLGPDSRYGTYSSGPLSTSIPSYQPPPSTAQPGVGTHAPSVRQFPTVINDCSSFYGGIAPSYQPRLPVNSAMKDVGRDTMAKTTTKSNTISGSFPSAVSSTHPSINTEKLPPGGVAYSGPSIASVLNKIKENAEIAASSSKARSPNNCTIVGDVPQGVASADHSVSGSVNTIMGDDISSPPSTQTIAKLHQATVEDGNNDEEAERAVELVQEFSERRKSSLSAGSLGEWGVVEPEEGN